MIFNDFNINLALQVVTGDTKLFDEQDENYKNLLLASLHDNNSSTLRELIIMRYLGYTSFDKKHGADGIDPTTKTLIEVKPKYIAIDSDKAGGGGNFNDLTMDLLNYKKEYSVVCGAIYDLKLVYIVEFPLIEIYDQLKKAVDRAKIGQRVVASFSHTDYGNAELLKVHYLDEDIIYECLTQPHANLLKMRNDEKSMTALKDILNKKFSTRNISDQDFELAIPDLAKELEQLSFYDSYTDDDLNKDWKKLCDWTTTDNMISSTSRFGMKLSEHYCQNFFDIENHNGVSFRKLWTATNLEKILRWNRKSHSTPYMSELKRGIYLCCGLPKSTMYRPQMMKLACIKYQPKTVLDPCAGWGGRMLGAVSYGANYIGFEPNTTTYANLQNIVNFLGIQDKVTLICDDARNMNNYNLPKVEMVLTSPPYFNLEVYAHEDSQSITGIKKYKEWSDKFLKEVIRLGIDKLADGGVSCWNVGKVSGNDMNDDVVKYHEEFGYEAVDVLTVSSSMRQMNQTTKTKNKKSADNTNVYKKKLLTTDIIQ